MASVLAFGNRVVRATLAAPFWTDPWKSTTWSPAWEADVGIFAVFFVLQVLVYVAIRGFARTQQQRSYVLSLLASVIFVIFSPVMLYVHGFARCYDSPATRALTLFYLAYMAAEVTVGLADFLPLIDPLSGWFHHACYTYVLYYILTTRRSMVFAPFMLEELPTLLMSLGRLGIWRNDYVFGAAFFGTRIAYHYAGAAGVWFMPCMRAYRPFLALTVGVHTYWGYSWVKGQLRRERRRLAVVTPGDKGAKAGELHAD